MQWRKMTGRLLDLIYPRRAVCMGCGSIAGFEQDWLCEECRRTLQGQWLGAFADARLDGAAAAYHYRGPAGNIVRNLKYRGVRQLAEPMAASMLSAYETILPTSAELVTAVPMHPRRRWLRGFNQADLLAQQVAARLDLPCVALLTRTRNTPQQALLMGRERRDNVRDAFCAAGEVRGRRVLLIDDVYTTGETARACAKALRAAGARSVSFLAYAKGK